MTPRHGSPRSRTRQVGLHGLALRRLLVGLLLPAALLLTGCVRIDMTTKIVSEHDIQMNVDYAVDTSGLGESMDPAQFCGTGAQNSKAGVESYREGTYIGCRIKGTMALSQISASEQGVSIGHANGEWTFAMNLTGLDTSQFGDVGSALSASMVDSMHVAVTFPGRVLTHSGSSTVQGTTVTWTNPDDLTAGLRATARDRSPIITALLRAWPYLAGLVLVAGAAALVVRRRRSQTPPAGQAPPQQGFPPQGFSQQGFPQMERAPGVIPPAPPVAPWAPPATTPPLPTPPSAATPPAAPPPAAPPSSSPAPPTATPHAPADPPTPQQSPWERPQ